ncbi:acyltransferase family protein [Acetobacter sp.]|uniref:acyltransferase family protein n=1 Tax=Acetobacter sp. TaxID=440 RepID=UPI003D02979B
MARKSRSVKKFYSGGFSYKSLQDHHNHQETVAAMESAHYYHLKYRPDIDGLRAFAVLSVVICHAFPTFLSGGFIGVDVFFVISGYLITTIILKNIENKSFSFSEFYLRRIKRIFPSLIFVLSFCLLIGWYALFPPEYKQLGKYIFGGAGFFCKLPFLSRCWVF